MMRPAAAEKRRSYQQAFAVDASESAAVSDGGVAEGVSGNGLVQRLDYCGGEDMIATYLSLPIVQEAIHTTRLQTEQNGAASISTTRGPSLIC
jgi:hypothetical protein